MLDPFDVGDHRHPLPAGDVLHADLEILPRGARVVAGKVRADFIEQPDLVVRLERLVDGGDQHRLVVVLGYLTVRAHRHDIIGKAFEQFDHRGLSWRLPSWSYWRISCRRSRRSQAYCYCRSTRCHAPHSRLRPGGVPEDIPYCWRRRTSRTAPPRTWPSHGWLGSAPPPHRRVSRPGLGRKARARTQ